MTRENRILTIAASMHFLTHMFMLIFPAVVLPISREMNAPTARIISLGFFLYMLYGGLAMPAGFLADRWSRIFILKVCALGMSVSSFMVGYSSSETGLLVSLSSLGFFCGLYHPAGLGLIAHEIGKQGRAHGINGIFGNLGIGAAPLFAGAMLLASGWRSAFYLCSVMGMVGLAAVWFLQVEERDKGTPASGAQGKNGANNAKYFAILLAAMTMAGLIYRANSVALPTMLETSAGGFLTNIITLAAERFGKDAGSGAAALLVSSLFMFSVIGQAVGGMVADRMDLRRGYLLFHGVSTLFIASVAWLSGLPLYLAAAGMVFFNLGIQPIENSLVSKFIPARWISTGYGIKFTFTFGVGSLAVWQVAWAETSIGLKHLYSILALEAALATSMAILLLFATRTIKSMTTSIQNRDMPGI